MTFDPTTTTRPTRHFSKYCLLLSLLSLVAFPVVFLPLYFKYISSVRFDDKGLSMCWGILCAARFI